MNKYLFWNISRWPSSNEEMKIIALWIQFYRAVLNKYNNRWLILNCNELLGLTLDDDGYFSKI